MNKTIIALAMFMAAVLNVRAEVVPEVRGVWLTTNMGLDWPSGVFDPEAQRARLRVMLDRLQACHFNLVIFQVEANGDALWQSSMQPAMRSVTGAGDRALSYDVGRFVADECHRRGMECHAWIVPYRLGNAKNADAYRDNPIRHPYYTCRDFAVDYEGTRYLDPGNPLTLDYLRRLYAELLADCPYDGISLDYTRYPGKRFADAGSYEKHAADGLPLDDWRRDNVNRFVAMIDSLAQTLCPGIVVGSAPIGTYRNVGDWKNATAYGSYNQDPAEWIASGHHDLIVPQMYWGEDRGFSDHISTWTDVAGDSATLVVGLAPYKMVDGSRWTAADVVALVETARHASGVSGVCFFRAEHVVGDAPQVKALRRRLAELFAEPAPLPWAQIH